MFELLHCLPNTSLFSSGIFYQWLYAWTALLAVHFLLTTVLSHSGWIEKLTPLYNTVAWTLPIIVSLPLLLSGKLGYTPTYPTACYISAYITERESSEATLTVVEEILWGVEAVCAIITVVCFVVMFANICCKVCANSIPSYENGSCMIMLLMHTCTYCLTVCYYIVTRGISRVFPIVWKSTPWEACKIIILTLCVHNNYYSATCASARTR